MPRSLVALVFLSVVACIAACTGRAPAGSAGATGSVPAGATAPIGATTLVPGAATPAGAAGTASPVAGGEQPAAGDLTVEQLCAALTAEEMSETFGEEVTIDPAETVWCGYDFEDGSGMFLVASGNDSAEEFMEQAETFECETRTVDVGGAVISSCGADQEEGRPSEAWFLLDGVAVQVSVNVEATEEQYLEMIRQALD